MRFWQGLGYTPIDELEPLAQHAEALGFHGVTLGDHWVTAETQLDRYEIAADGERPWEADAPWPDPWVQFAALARATERLHFMSTVYILPLRDVFTAAKAISTASVVSGGRVHLGVGVGWQSLEFALVGQPFDRRGRHADEQLAVLEKLWSGEMVEHHGEFYDFPPVCMLPRPADRIPIYIGGTSRAAFARAARHAGWEGAVYPWPEIDGYLQALRRAREDAAGPESAAPGTARDRFRTIVGCTEPTPERLAQLRAWGVTDYLKPPWTAGLKPTRVALTAKLDEMSRFADDHRHHFESETP